MPAVPSLPFRYIIHCAFVILMLCLSREGLSQEVNDTVAGAKENTESQYNPRRAAYMSMIVPGLGQVYNKKYWKVPIIYGGFYALYYLIKLNDDRHENFKEAYLYVHNQDSGIIGDDIRSLVNTYTADGLLQGKKYYKKNRDFSYILMAVLYLLNIFDANVDAHLRDFDISDDLSLSIAPEVYHGRGQHTNMNGLRITLKF